MFALDWRSLALFRMGLAAVILADLVICSTSLTAFYTDDGVMPRSILLANDLPMVSVHFSGGNWGFIGGLFVLEGVLASMLLLGYRTNLATVGCWFMIVSRQARNPLVLFGPDMMLHIALFWAIFLPLNRRYSLDVAVGRTSEPAERSYLGMAGFAYVVQFLLIYFMSAVLKTGDTWRVDGTAVYYSLSIEMYQQPLGAWLNQYDDLTRQLTFWVIDLETYGPLLFVLPFWSGWGRIAGCLVFAALQIGFGLCMKMGLFGPIMIAIMLPFLPDQFWKYLAEPFGQWLSLLTARWRIELFPSQRIAECLQRCRRCETATTTHCTFRAAAAQLPAMRMVRDAVLLGALGAVLLSNLGDISNGPWLPPEVHWYARQVGLNQTFTMFAPDPQRADGWFVLRGTLANGQSVNLLNDDSPVDLSKPISIAATYTDQRWCTYLLSLLDPSNRAFLDPFTRYFGRKWNEVHSDVEQLLTLELIFMSEATAADHTKQPIEEVLLWIVSYNNSA